MEVMEGPMSNFYVCCLLFNLFCPILYISCVSFKGIIREQGPTFNDLAPNGYQGVLINMVPVMESPMEVMEGPMSACQ